MSKEYLRFTTGAGIYQIVHTASGRKYIGSSFRVRSRLKRHMADLAAGKHHCIFLQRLYTKHGRQAFAMSMVCHVPDRSMILKFEQFYIDETKKAGLLLNTCETAGNCSGVKHSEETKRLRSEAAMGRPRAPGVGAAISAAKRGKTSEAIKASAVISGMARRFQLSSEQVEYIVESNRLGATMQDICAEFGCSHHPMLREIRKHRADFAPVIHANPRAINKGEAHGMARLTSENVERIRKSKFPHADIAAEFGISRGYVGEIRRRRSWAHE